MKEETKDRLTAEFSKFFAKEYARARGDERKELLRLATIWPIAIENPNGALNAVLRWAYNGK